MNGIEAFQGLAAQGQAWTEQMGLELMALLEKQCALYTGGLSSSVRAEVAQALLASIFYVLQTRYEGLTPRQRLQALSAQPLAQSYREGLKRVKQQVHSAQLLYQTMLPRRLDTSNRFYQDTLLGGIPGFFKLYRPDLFAQEVHITADYPVLFYPQGTGGVAFIRAYLSAWQLEDRFCRQVDPARMRRAWALYAIHHGERMEDLCANLYLVALAGELAWGGGAGRDRWKLDAATARYVEKTLAQRAADLDQAAAVLKTAGADG